LEILKRAKGDSGEIVAWNENPENVREEVNKRTAKAGYTTKYGEPEGRTKIMAQPANDRYRKNYKRIFGHD